MPEDPLKAVFDCNVIWQAFFSENGAAGKCKRLVDTGEVTLYLSAEVLREMRDVLTRPETQARFSKATSEAVDAFLQDLADRAVLVKSVPRKFTYTRDPKDEPCINLAVAADADYIVSRDKDLLGLMTGYTQECKVFRQRFRPLEVVDPVTFLQKVEKTRDDTA